MVNIIKNQFSYLCLIQGILWPLINPDTLVNGVQITEAPLYRDLTLFISRFITIFCLEVNNAHTKRD